MKNLAFAVMAMVITGCASLVAAPEPTAEQIAKANFFSAPDASEIEPGIRTWALDGLKDPESMQLRDIGEPQKGWLAVCIQDNPVGCQERRFYFGYVVVAKLNAKNAMGGYGGYQTYRFLFRANKVFMAQRVG